MALCSCLFCTAARRKKSKKSLPTAKMGKAKTIPKLIQCPKASKVPLLFGWLASKFTSPLSCILTVNSSQAVQEITFFVFLNFLLLFSSTPFYIFFFSFCRQPSVRVAKQAGVMLLAATACNSGSLASESICLQSCNKCLFANLVSLTPFYTFFFFCRQPSVREAKQAGGLLLPATACNSGCLAFEHTPVVLQ